MAEEKDPNRGVPVLPLRDVVVYPHMVIPLFVGREKSIQALDVAMKGDKRIMLVAQRQADVDDPKADDLYRFGTVATILQLLKLPDGTVKVLVEGVDRARIERLHANLAFIKPGGQHLHGIAAGENGIAHRRIKLCAIRENFHLVVEVNGRLAG